MNHSRDRGGGVEESGLDNWKMEPTGFADFRGETTNFLWDRGVEDGPG